MLTFLLNKISEKYDKNSIIGIYRDDELSVFKNKPFKDFGLEIVAESNLKIVNYLDMTLNLNEGSHRPYHKPNDTI